MAARRAGSLPYLPLTSGQKSRRWKEGYGGAGIDALTKAAGVTNGAFYGHFKSKSEAFRTAVVEGLEELRQAILALKKSQPKDWLKALAGFYLGHKRTCDLGDSCTLRACLPM